MLTTWRVHNRHSLHGFTAQKVLAPFHWRIFPCIPSRSESKSKLLGPRPWQDFRQDLAHHRIFTPKVPAIKRPSLSSTDPRPYPSSAQADKDSTLAEQHTRNGGRPTYEKTPGSVRWDFPSHCMTPVIQVMTRVFASYLLGLSAITASYTKSQNLLNDEIQPVSQTWFIERATRCYITPIFFRALIC